MRARGGWPRIVATGIWGRRSETLARLEAWNQPIHHIRGRIDKIRASFIFGTWKGSYGLRRMRWRGLAKLGVKFASPPSLQYETLFEGHRYGWIAGKNTTDARTKASEDTADVVGADIFAPFTLEAKKIK